MQQIIIAMKKSVIAKNKLTSVLPVNDTVCALYNVQIQLVVGVTHVFAPPVHSRCDALRENRLRSYFRRASD